MSSLSPWQRRALKAGLGATAGAALGFAYYTFVGCSTGGCAITSDPLVTSGYGAVLGGLFAGA
ncbi:MAG: hypothetical protein JRF63_10675 [Deltaproteobacteria bacterium]|nr:hypothetical protein [Deltaproteobacteria bacterium]